MATAAARSPPGEPRSRRSLLYPLDWLEERSGLVGGDEVLPLPQGPARHELVPDARLGDADRLPRPGDHRRDPRDLLQAGPGQGLRVDPVHHERPDARLARPRHAPLGRERLHHPDVPPHGARLPVRRLQVPARAELDHRRAPARCSGCSRASPATCCPCDQTAYWATVVGINLNGTAPFLGPFLAQFLQAGPRSARTRSQFYAIHMLLDPGRDLRPDRAAPVPRRSASASRSPPWSKTRPGRDRPDAVAATERPRGARAAAAGAEARPMASRRVVERRARAQALQGGRRARAASRSSRTRCSTTR